MVAIAMISCGGDKPKNVEVDDSKVTKDNYVIEMDAIYEKNDSIVFFFEVDGSVKYEYPISLKVTGSPTIQHLSVKMPENVSIENLTCTVSTNKDQTKVFIPNITIKNGDKVIDGSDFKYGQNFLTDESFKWNESDKNYILTHTNKYPPGLVGSENLKALLSE